ncbi:neprilysin-2-like [Episyrphus balteatus]|uniref:neprilysin-2-like n=1 Tax=Episyrphus balteatus TaxID=286459 RepID=UPI0024856EF5|nr:neprilysin-2-like [Episyrphus balteatus]
MRLLLISLLIIFIINKVHLCNSVPTTFENEILHGKDENENINQFRESFAKRMQSFMNTSADPCDDFYAYACGNYPNVIEDNEIERKQRSLTDLSHVIDEFVDKILQKERQPDDMYYDELQVVKQYLEICDSSKLWPLSPSEEYLTVIKSIGGFPALDPTWNVSTFDWFNMTANLIRYGVVGLIKEEIFLKHPFPPYYEIPRFGFNFDVYSDNIETNESHGYVHNVKIMKELLDLYRVNDTDEVIEEIIELWKEALIFQDKAINRRSCRRLAFEDDMEEYEFPKWKSLFEIAWNANDSSKFDGSDCPCDWYFKKLDDISVNKSRSMANYMALKFLYTMHPQLKSTKYQHQYCVTQIKKTMPLILTYFYVKEHFSKDDQKEVEEMIVQLRASFIKLIQSSDWLDTESRIGNEKTIQNLKASVGEVVDPMSDIYIREIKKINLTDNFAMNNLEASKHRINMRHYAFMQENLDNKTSPFEVLNAIQVNAFYDLIKHGIYVLPGVLFPPVYHKYLPQSVKYGGLGYIIGHEMVHSLDFRGREFEKYFQRHSAWSEASAKMVTNRSLCFAEHHRNYTVPVLDIKLNKTKNTKESIADAGGLREAFDTYRSVYQEAVKNKIKDFEQMENLPGLELTPDQTFFLSFAQVYCAKYEPKHYWSEIYEDHPMDRYRVISPLQNLEEFSMTFNCSLGTSMNPKRKCRLW